MRGARGLRGISADTAASSGRWPRARVICTKFRSSALTRPPHHSARSPHCPRESPKSPLPTSSRRLRASCVEAESVPVAPEPGLAWDLLRECGEGEATGSQRRPEEASAPARPLGTPAQPPRE